MTLVPKKKARQAEVEDEGATVRDISSAPRARPRGRPSGLGYDSRTGEEVISSTYVESDVFALVSERGYRPDRFYTKSTNSDGHGERMNVRIPQGLDSQIHAAVGEIPEYRSVQDFFRDAAVHRLEFLQKQYVLGEGARRILELERIGADSERRQQETEMMSEAVETLDSKLQRLWDKRDWAMMAEELELAGELCDWLREPYKSKAAEVLKGWKVRAKELIQKAARQMEGE